MSTGNPILSAIEFILAITFMAFLHELGHYLTARMFKIEVEEFGLGIPPRLVKLFTFKGTDFTLNAIPFGAFVRPKGEMDPSVPDGLSAAPAYQRIIVLLGGPVMNLIAGILVFAIYFNMAGVPDKVAIAAVLDNTPAAQAGLQVGDVVQSINGKSIVTTSELSSTIRSYAGTEITLSILRNGQAQVIRATPRTNPPMRTLPDGTSYREGALGISSTGIQKSVAFGDAIPYGFQATGDLIKELVSLPGRIIGGQVSAEESRLVSIVGMVQMYTQIREVDSQAAASGTSQIPAGAAPIHFLALVSVALGFTNLLPIPGLDGGRLAFILVEFVLRRRLNPETEARINGGFLVALLALIGILMLQDLINPINLLK